MFTKVVFMFTILVFSVTAAVNSSLFTAYYDNRLENRSKVKIYCHNYRVLDFGHLAPAEHSSFGSQIAVSLGLGALR
jgi:hypothetical protein